MENYNQGVPGYYENRPPLAAKKPAYKPSLILGIIAIASLWFTLGLSGLVCGIISINLARTNRQEYNTTAGFVLGQVSVFIGIVILTIVVSCVAVIVIMPHSIGAYYLQDILDSILPGGA